MLSQLGSIWKFRTFLLSLIRKDLRARYRKSALGAGWSFLHPILMTVVFCLVFGAWFSNPDWRSYGPYFLAGMTLFSMIRESVVAGCSTFYANENYIRQSPAPLVLYTLRTVIGIGIHFLIALAVVFAAVLVLQPDLRLKVLSVLWVFVPALALLFIFCWSISVIASFISVYFNDASHLAEVFFQILFFLTPIFFPVQMMVDRGLTVLLQINPIVAFLEIIRSPLIYGQAPPAWAFAKAAIVTVLAATCAIGTMAVLQKKLIYRL
jgi:homopolymeric O-antigen transport system permease protein